jgi:hypothetical protein
MKIGATSDEVQRALRLEHQSISPRTTELHQAGYIELLLEDNKPVTRLTAQGRPAQVWIATKRGKDVIRLDLPLWIGKGDITASHHKGNPQSITAHESSDRGALRRRVLAEFVKRTP